MQNKNIILLAIGLLVIFCSSISFANPTVYTGSLSSVTGGGIDGNGGTWTDDETTPGTPVTLSWTITRDTDVDPWWHYEYTLNTEGSQGTISHFILEVSTSFTLENIRDLSHSIESGDPTDYGSSNSNPDIPDDIWGIKFDTSSATEVTVISFYSCRNPVWGDFYAKGGINGGAAWNSGFTGTDPTARPDNGSYLNHLLVPDTTCVPAPGAFLLGGIGVSLVGWIKRHRNL